MDFITEGNLKRPKEFVHTGKLNFITNATMYLPHRFRVKNSKLTRGLLKIQAKTIAMSWVRMASLHFIAVFSTGCSQF